MRTFITSILALICMSAYGQQANIAEQYRMMSAHIRSAAIYAKRVPHEKVYLHFDNTGYFEGETIWFKAYVTRADSHRATDLSRVLYVELLNPSGDVVKSKKLHLDDNGQAHGELQLDTIYGSGFYEVRAYTRYMTNWGTNACFSRVFPIFVAPSEEGDYANPTIRTTLRNQRDPNNRDHEDSLYIKAIDKGIYTSNLETTISAKFYPEGGDLIVGKQSRVALLTVDDNGRCYSGEGWVTNARGDVLTKVTTDSLGRGLFDITPDGSKLTMQMKNLKGKTQTFDLPMAKVEGCALTLNATDDDMLLKLQSTDALCGNLMAYMIMHEGNIIHLDTMVATPLIEVELSRSTMPEGVNQITIIDHNGQVMAERLFFVTPQPSPADTVSVTSVTQRLKPCGKVEMTLQTEPGASLSFTAMDGATMNNRKQGNIKTWMLLDSDIKGYIHDVNYYFESDDQTHRRAADLLMLTQGWRRYDWNIMAGLDTIKRMQPVEDKLYIFGQLGEFRKWNHVGGVEMDAFLFNKDGQSLKGNTTTDADGNYAFALPDIAGEWQMQLFTKVNDKRKTYRVGIDRQISPVARYITPLESTVRMPNMPNMFMPKPGAETVDDEEFIPITHKDHVLQTVKVNGKRRYFTNDDWQYKKESYGSRYATLYYDIDRELDNIRDRGEKEPTVFEFLCRKNALFGNPECRDLPSSWWHTEGDEAEKFLSKMGNTESFTPSVEVSANLRRWNNGLSYGGRPIHWIVDNGQTNNGGGYSYGSRFYADEFFPLFLDEIKSIYIVPSSPWETSSCVRIYIYRHHIFSSESNKGLRKTYFEGYSQPATFEMEDYSVLPPMADFRRTIYWQPDLTTDADGKCHVEFYNNSTCTEMFVNTEGMTPDGRYVAY